MLFFHNGWDSFPPVSGVLPHFDMYREMNREVFERVIADQITFLRTHLLAPSIHEPSLGPKEHIVG